MATPVIGRNAALVESAAEPPSSRQLVVWVPDWPLVALTSENGHDPRTPIAVIEKGEVFACSEAARIEGVRRGMRKRDAAARCPGLELLDRHPESEIRTFELVLAQLEEITAGVAPIRPGLCAMAVPSRFYGSEQAAAAVVAEHLVTLGIWDCRFGIADGRFAAEQAARRAVAQECAIIEPGGSGDFLRGLPIAVLDDATLVGVLRRLGLRTLGDFADLPARDVATRFGSEGAWLHRLARGRDHRPPVSRRPPLEIDQQVVFQPGLETIEPITFSTRQTAERCVAELARHGLVCTQLRIEVVTDGGWTGTRVWAHSRWFTATDMIDRLYWQLQGDPAPEPVCEVRLLPDAVESLADHGEGLWGRAADEQVERGIARLQGMLGPEEVLAPSLSGGRSPRDRQRLTPWGDRRDDGRPRGLPWPGSLPPPAPARVFGEPVAAALTDHEHTPVGVTDRGMVTGVPAYVRPGPRQPEVAVDAWAGPWPIEELWWDPAKARRVARFQVVGIDGRAWLMIIEDGRCWTEAEYV